MDKTRFEAIRSTISRSRDIEKRSVEMTGSYVEINKKLDEISRRVEQICQKVTPDVSLRVYEPAFARGKETGRAWWNSGWDEDTREPLYYVMVPRQTLIRWGQLDDAAILAEVRKAISCDRFGTGRRVVRENVEPTDHLRGRGFFFDSGSRE